MSLSTQHLYDYAPVLTAATAEHRHTPVRDCSLHGYLHRVLEILSELEVVALGQDHAESLTMLALDAQQAFFAAARFHPDERQLDNFLYEFIRLCVVPTPHTLP
jgi:hypothetical protein